MNRKVQQLLATVLPIAGMAMELPQRKRRSDWRRHGEERSRNKKKNRPLTKGEKRNREHAHFIGKPLGVPCNNARTRKLRGLPTKLSHL